MHAAVIDDGAVSWEELPDPRPRAGDLLVRVEAAGLNGADLLQRAGHYPPPSGSSVAHDQPGLECAGTVEAVGEGVDRFKPGDRVMGLVAGAGQAELALVHERIAMPIPERCSFVAAGGFPEVFTTAHDALFAQAGLGSGERLLVNGAAGGVGVAAVQLAVAAGASVVASVRHASSREAVAALGASAAAPEEAFEQGPFDVVLELVGGPNLPGDLDSLAMGGRIVVIGLSAGRTSELDLRLIMGRRATLRGSTLRARSLEEKAIATRRVERHVLPLLADGRLEVPISATFPFAEAETAYERFAAGGKFGKIVLVR